MAIIISDFIDSGGGDFGLISLSRQGLTFKNLFDYVEGSGFPLEDWASWLRLNVSELLQKRNKEGFLEPHQSERVLEINRLLHHGKLVLGNVDMLVNWFNHNSIPLGGITPKSLLDNTFGIEMVHAELGRIEHGVLA